MQDLKDYVTTMWLCKPNLETSQPELNLPSISYQFGSSVLQSKARESALQTATASRPLQPGTIHISCQQIDWAGSENGDFCWFSLLYLCWHRGWVGRKSPKMCWRNIWMVPPAIHITPCTVIVLYNAVFPACPIIVWLVWCPICVSNFFSGCIGAKSAIYIKKKN